MRILHDEIIRRFPEVQACLYKGDEDLPYTMMMAVAEWLKGLSPVELTPDIVRRVIDFDAWCLGQPRGETADDDMLTIYVVGFLEELFKSGVTRALIPHLLSKEDLVECAEYWTQWTTPGDYQAALRLY